VTLLVQRPADQDRETNAVALGVAPELLTVSPNPAARNPAGTVTLTTTCRPTILAGQSVSLLVGSREVRAQPPPASPLTFVVPRAPVGKHWLRLRVDGVDSLLVDRSVSPPVFDPSQRVTIT
jgi:hypothetical protein